MRVTVWLGLAATALMLGACASPGPFRDASDALVNPAAQSSCGQLYASTDATIAKIASDFDYTDDQRNAQLLAIDKTIHDTQASQQHCWRAAYEHHDAYDLYYAEFDDAGQPVDTARPGGTAYDQSELHLIENSISHLIKDSSTPLDIVVFTHGWHGNAQADNAYSVEFKGILQDIAARERGYQVTTEVAGVNGSGVARQEHRVLGIEIAWRGDSFLNPTLIYPGSQNALNVWDRKLAAATVSGGAAQELLAYLNEVYLDNSCHGLSAAVAQQEGKDCDRVHMLSIGHSFGALINFEALNPRLESGLNAPCGDRAYGYGDMTILLNPAFEAARYRALWETALHRPELIGDYFDSAHPDPRCTTVRSYSPPKPASAEKPEVQLPILVILQSQGDTATEDFFPFLQNVTTFAAQTLSPTEASDKGLAVGWAPDFRTHHLDPSLGSDNCTPWPSTPASYCPFRSAAAAELTPSGPKRMTLSWTPTQSGLPAYLPLWSVAVSSQIMKNHDDFWNPQIVRLVSVLFVDAYEQDERLHGPQALDATASH